MKVYLEQHGYYDKTRKITPVNNGFGVPIMNMDIEQVKLELSQDLQPIFLPENILSVSLEASFSIKQKTSQYLSDWCKQGTFLLYFHYIKHLFNLIPFNSIILNKLAIFSFFISIHSLVP